MGTNPVIDARDLVAELFPLARWAVLNGSMRPSAGSDLDIVVLLPDGDPRACRNDARRFLGRPVELYLHDELSLDAQIAWELGVRKPFLHRIVTTGATIAGDPAVWRGRCTAATRPLANRGRRAPQRDADRPAGARAFARGPCRATRSVIQFEHFEPQRPEATMPSLANGQSLASQGNENAGRTMC